MSTQRIAELLAERLGHDVAALGDRIFEQVLSQARSALNAHDNAALFAQIDQSERAFHRLTELLVIPETWFFRMQEQFDDMLRFARACTARPIRVLSLPCSTGEEVYSILMALTDAGFAETDVDVTGWDISQAAIRSAARGQFSTRALRGQAPHPRWMQLLAGERLQIHPSLCERATFKVRNALNLAPAAEPRFHIIFCRNLLIYLKPEARTALLADLRTMLEPQGLLLAGLAELIPSMAPGFQHWTQGTPLSFTLANQSETSAFKAAAEKAELHATRTEFKVRGQAADASISAKALADVVNQARDSAIQATRASAELARAQALANAGDLSAAQSAVTSALLADPQACNAHFLAGILALAADDLAAADTAFLRTQYLQPDHLAALEHRAAIAKRLDAPNAAELSQRAIRLRQRLSAST